MTTKPAPEKELRRRRGRGGFAREQQGNQGEFEVIEQDSEEGPARSIEGWDLIVTNIHEVRSPFYPQHRGQNFFERGKQISHLDCDFWRVCNEFLGFLLFKINTLARFKMGRVVETRDQKEGEKIFPLRNSTVPPKQHKHKVMVETQTLLFPQH